MVDGLFGLKKGHTHTNLCEGRKGGTEKTPTQNKCTLDTSGFTWNCNLIIRLNIQLYYRVIKKNIISSKSIKNRLPRAQKGSKTFN